MPIPKDVDVDEQRRCAICGNRTGLRGLISLLTDSPSYDPSTGDCRRHRVPGKLVLVS